MSIIQIYSQNKIREIVVTSREVEEEEKSIIFPSPTFRNSEQIDATVGGVVAVAFELHRTLP